MAGIEGPGWRVGLPDLEPRIAEDLLLDRVNGGNVVDASGTYAVRGGRGVPPI